MVSAVHRISKGDHVLVALINSKIDTEQPDIAGAVTDEFDAGCGADAAPDPHGTGMAGAIASHLNLLGVAPGAKLIAICAFGGHGTPESSSVKIIKGLDYAIKHGAKILNMSFAGPRDPAVARGVARAGALLSWATTRPAVFRPQGCLDGLGAAGPNFKQTKSAAGCHRSKKWAYGRERSGDHSSARDRKKGTRRSASIAPPQAEKRDRVPPARGTL